MGDFVRTPDLPEGYIIWEDAHFVTLYHEATREQVGMFTIHVSPETLENEALEHQLEKGKTDRRIREAKRRRE